MAQSISTTWRASGSSMANAAARNLKPTAPAINTSNGIFRTITQITRKDGVWCNCGGTVYTVTLAHTDKLIDTSTDTVIKTSNTVNSKCTGSGPAAENYATTTFSSFTAAESQAVIKAWNAGTLQIKRSVSIVSYDSAGHGSPTFRSGSYHDDITITGTTAAYDPVLKLNSFVKAAENVFYASSGSTAPFTFSLATTINGSSYWEGSTVSKRLEITVENLSGGSAPLNAITAATSNNTTATTWTLTQANFSFVRANGGFNRGNRYRVTFTFKVGSSASNLTESASVSVEITVATVPLHLNRYGNGVGLGMYSSIANANADGAVDMGWELNANAGIRGVTNYVAGEAATGGKWIDGKPIYRYVGTAEVKTTGISTLVVLPSYVDTLIESGGSLDAENGSNLSIPGMAYNSVNYNVAFYLSPANTLNIHIGASLKGTNKVMYWVLYTKA